MTSPSQFYSKASSAALVLLGGSLIWSLLAGGLQILSTLQLLIPLLSRILPISFFGYGRLVPAYTFLLAYGWIGSGLLGVLIILVPRISGIAFRYGRVLLGGALLWQLGVLIGLTQLLWEGSTGLLSLSFSSSVTLIFFTSFLVLGTGITRGLGGAWKSGPLLPRLYLLGALLAFPLGLGTSELILRHSLAPGSVQIITQLVGYSFLHHLWLTPLALVLLFQLLTALTGRAISSLPLGLLSWMATFTLGGWLGNAHISDGPVPSWMQSAGVVATLLIFIAALGNGVLFRPLFEGKIDEIRRNVALRLLSVGAWTYVVAYGWLAFLALPGVRQNTSFTMVSNATQTIFFFGFFGCILTGSIYALLPVSRNVGWPSHPALTWHFWCTTLGVALTASSYALAGIFQGLAWNDPGVPLSTISSYLRPFLCTALIGQSLWLIGQIAFSALFFSAILKLFPTTAPWAIFPNPPPAHPDGLSGIHS